MTSALTVAGGSAVVLIMLMTLFRVEEAYGHRVILGGVRDFLDRVVESIGAFCSRCAKRFGTGAFQATFHFLVHRLLSRLIRVLTKFESYLSHLQLRNKRIAFVMKEGGRRTHLHEIASHKEEVSLSAAERRKRTLH